VAEARIETHRRRLLVARDGEVEWMESPLHYRTRPAALRVLVPQENPSV
jgi:diacylglycerol kinase family enzyme